MAKKKKSLINLDAFGNEPKKKAGEEAAKPSESAQPITGMDLVISKKSLKKESPKASSLAEIYDASARLIFMFDNSGSMGGRVGGDVKAEVTDYRWNDWVIRDIMTRVNEAQAFVNRPPGTIVVFDQEAIDVTNKFAELAGLEGDVLKQKIIDLGLDKELYLPPSQTSGKNKLGLVKRVSKKMVDKRFDKYPNALVAAMSFSDHAEMLAFDDREALLTAIDAMPLAGGTNIMEAIDTAMSLCRKSPSPVHLHHLVLVSDGVDNGAMRMPEMVPKFKELGIVLDFIHITGAGDTCYGDDSTVADAIRRACEATGGEYTAVANAEDFEMKFIAASSRLLLPPGK